MQQSRWDEHFRLTDDFEIEGITEIGQVTATVFGFNTPERIDERRILSIFPHPS